LATYNLPNFNPTGGKITLGTTTYTIPAITGNVPRSLGVNDDEHLKHPGSAQFSLGMAHQFGQALAVSADFVYIYGYNQFIYRNGNINEHTAPFYYPLNADFLTIPTMYNAGYSTNKSLRGQIRYRTHRGDSIQLAYTYQRAFDNGPGAILSLPTGQTQQTDPFDTSIDWGPTGIPRHSMNVAATLRIPFGVNFSPILNFATGAPFTATTTSRTISVPACPVYYDHCYPPGYSKNSLWKPNTWGINARLSKVVKFAERYKASAFFEAYNVTNRLNVTALGASYGSTTFLKPSTASARRQLQLGFQFEF